MPKTVTVNGCRLTTTPQTSFDPTSQTGTITASYYAGYWDGTAFHDYPPLTLKGAAQEPLAATDTAGAKLLALCQLILSQEGLDPTQGDHVYDSTLKVLL